MNRHAEMLELAAIHALGALDEVERVRFERHLRDGCTRCRATLRESSRVVDPLALSVAPVTPSPFTRQRLLEGLDRVRRQRLLRAPVRRSRRSWVPWAAAASIAVLAGLALYADPAALLHVRETVYDLTMPNLRSVSLSGTGALASSQVRAYVDPDRSRLVLYAYSLPPAPGGRDYQLWVIGEGAPVSAGVFAPHASGVVRHEVEAAMPLRRGITLAVSVEPKGGAPQPTGPIVLSGS